MTFKTEYKKLLQEISYLNSRLASTEEGYKKLKLDFESRTCENCEWWTYYDGTNMCMELMIPCGKNFGCNKFERKETK